ncbi:hypothetical protein GCM10010116_35470 [Microbispora rosea subsp. aerata]|nr:hypothetical protein [Microbispora rosea]GGO17538.1 hypothetical protein GCM10010116_35470 [Microbispora rosea subsp. aerata]GIH56561.1 hypothetical protein Mro02_34750 [Microbispora rosea subsp. aerata]GLJ81910.1 hypothetical protein GCM10017588_06350 [Microbispora rosea subsp. aerata]
MRLPAGLPAGLTAAVALAAVVTGCGSSPTASTAETPVYVLNFQDSEQGRPDQRPASLVLSEFSTMSGVTWRTWGPTRATGAGKLSGTWCLPECADAPYDATVTLSSVVPVKGKGYFSRYAVTADVPAGQRSEADLSGVLPTP